ncbi:MAG: hypothetical protein DRJ52_05985 [Thermoprotei archaeon]|nr:MAG: hypothetical protein DRJ52_05985 [Thermoprotei archaeon]
MVLSRLICLDPYAKKINEYRRPRTNDIFERKCVIPPHKISLTNLAGVKPISAFNPGILLENNILEIYVRVIIGYFKYASMIARIDLPLDSLENCVFSREVDAEVVIGPDTWFDIWGAEDPRVFYLGRSKVMVYTGKTDKFYESSYNRTVPVIAVHDGAENRWIKTSYVTVPRPLDKLVAFNKDAFLVKIPNENKIHIFHRPVITNFPTSLWYGASDKNPIKYKNISPLTVKDNRIVMLPADFEYNIGWSTPLLEVDGKYIEIAHAQSSDRYYRLYALELEYSEDEGFEITGVSETYIMEPKELYEKYGDRPCVVFACGACIIKDRVIVSYGAADYFIGLAETTISDLLSTIKKIK